MIVAPPHISKFSPVFKKLTASPVAKILVMVAPFRNQRSLKRKPLPSLLFIRELDLVKMEIIDFSSSIVQIWPSFHVGQRSEGYSLDDRGNSGALRRFPRKSSSDSSDLTRKRAFF
jgi:hypothetical protein